MSEPSDHGVERTFTFEAFSPSGRRRRPFDLGRPVFRIRKDRSGGSDRGCTPSAIRWRWRSPRKVAGWSSRSKASRLVSENPGRSKARGVPGSWRCLPSSPAPLLGSRDRLL